MMESSSKIDSPFLFVLLCAILLSFPWLGQIDFTTRGEPREALVAQNMAATGHYLVGHGYGGEVASKPPLLHWLVVGVSKVRGAIDEFSARVPSASAALIFVCAYFFFLRARVGKEEALLTSLILLTSAEWFRAAVACRVDMVMAALTSGALLALFRWQERGCQGVPLVSILLLFMATLTKGFLAVVLPAAILFLFIVTVWGMPGKAVRKAFMVAGPLVLLSLIWFYVGSKVGGEAFRQKVLAENLQRFTSTMEDGNPHSHSAAYLFGTIPLGLMPWSLLLLGALPVVGRVIGALHRRAIPLRQWGSEVKSLWGRWSDLDRYFILAIVVFVVFFSIPESKRSVYLLPIYPFFALYVARFLRSLGGDQFRRVSLAVALLSLGVVVSYGLIGAVQHGSISLRSFIHSPRQIVQAQFFLNALTLSRGDLSSIQIGMLLLPLFASLIFLGFFWKKIRTGIVDLETMTVGIALYFVAILISLQGGVFPATLNRLSPRPFVESIRSLVPPEATLYSFGDEFYSVSFYLDRPMSKVSEHLDVGMYLVCFDKNLIAVQARLPDDTKMEVLATSAPNVLEPGKRLALVRTFADVGLR